MSNKSERQRGKQRERQGQRKIYIGNSDQSQQMTDTDTNDRRAGQKNRKTGRETGKPEKQRNTETTT